MTEAEIRAYLTATIQRVAGVDVALDTGFFAAGVTSAHLVQVHDELLRGLGRPRTVTALFRHTTVRRLATHLLQTETAEPRMPAGQEQRAPASSWAASRRELRTQIRTREGGR